MGSGKIQVSVPELPASMRGEATSMYEPAVDATYEQGIGEEIFEKIAEAVRLVERNVGEEIIEGLEEAVRLESRTMFPTFSDVPTPLAKPLDPLVRFRQVGPWSFENWLKPRLSDLPNGNMLAIAYDEDCSCGFVDVGDDAQLAQMVSAVVISLGSLD